MKAKLKNNEQEARICREEQRDYRIPSYPTKLKLRYIKEIFPEEYKSFYALSHHLEENIKHDYLTPLSFLFSLEVAVQKAREKLAYEFIEEWLERTPGKIKSVAEIPELVDHIRSSARKLIEATLPERVASETLRLYERFFLN